MRIRFTMLKAHFAAGHSLVVGVCKARSKEGATCDPRQQSCEQGLLCGGFCQAPDAGTCSGTVWRCTRASGEGSQCTAAEDAFRGSSVAGHVLQTERLMEPCRVTSDCDLTKTSIAFPPAVRTPAHKPRTLRSVKRAAFPALSCARPRHLSRSFGASASVGTCGPRHWMVNMRQSQDLRATGHLRGGSVQGPVAPSTCL